MEMLPEELFNLPIAEKKRRLAQWLKEQPRGTRQQLAIFCSRTSRAVSNWSDPQMGWISAELERKVWQFVAARSGRRKLLHNVPYPLQVEKLRVLCQAFHVETNADLAVKLGKVNPSEESCRQIQAWREGREKIEPWAVWVVHHLYRIHFSFFDDPVVDIEEARNRAHRRPDTEGERAEARAQVRHSLGAFEKEAFALFLEFWQKFKDAGFPEQRPTEGSTKKRGVS